ERVLKRREQSKRWKPEQVIRSLCFLALQMQRHDLTILFVEYLQPTWLSRRWRVFYRWCIQLIFGLISGLISGLIFGLILGLIFGLIFGLFSGLIFELDSRINTAEALIWSRREALLWLVLGLFSGLILGLAVGLAVGLATGLVVGLAV